MRYSTSRTCCSTVGPPNRAQLLPENLLLPELLSMRCGSCQEIALAQGLHTLQFGIWPTMALSEGCSGYLPHHGAPPFPNPSMILVSAELFHIFSLLSHSCCSATFFHPFLNMLSQRHHQLISSALASNRCPLEPSRTGCLTLKATSGVFSEKTLLPAPCCGYPTQRPGLECYGSLSEEAEA